MSEPMDAGFVDLAVSRFKQSLAIEKEQHDMSENGKSAETVETLIDSDDHYEIAEEGFRMAGESDGQDAALYLASANAHATMAVADAMYAVAMETARNNELLAVAKG